MKSWATTATKSIAKSVLLLQNKIFLVVSQNCRLEPMGQFWLDRWEAAQRDRGSRGMEDWKNERDGQRAWAGSRGREKDEETREPTDEGEAKEEEKGRKKRKKMIRKKLEEMRRTER